MLICRQTVQWIMYIFFKNLHCHWQKLYNEAAHLHKVNLNVALMHLPDTYPNRLKLHSRYTYCFDQFMHSLEVEPMTLVLLAPCFIFELATGLQHPHYRTSPQIANFYWKVSNCNAVSFNTNCCQCDTIMHDCTIKNASKLLLFTLSLSISLPLNFLMGMQ